jgi:hypothetical protein
MRGSRVIKLPATCRYSVLLHVYRSSPVRIAAAVPPSKPSSRLAVARLATRPHPHSKRASSFASRRLRQSTSAPPFSDPMPPFKFFIAGNLHELLLFAERLPPVSNLNPDCTFPLLTPQHRPRAAVSRPATIARLHRAGLAAIHLKCELRIRCL